MELQKRATRGYARLVRIAVGLLRPESRKRYVAEFRRRAVSRQRYARGERCLVCNAKKVRTRSMSYPRRNMTFAVAVCRECGHVSNPENFNDYSKYTSLKKMPIARRVGTENKPGREFHMASMGSEILERDGLTVMLYGPGRSTDYRRIREIDNVERVAVGDLMKFIDDAEWVDLKEPARERFDLLIASEVIEHFTDPAKDFPKMFSYIKDDGIVICSTNIYDGGTLHRQHYLFSGGHTSYYSPQAIAHLARKNNIYFDFRLPRAAETYAGPRKRYVLFTRSMERLGAIAQFFGAHSYAPSED